MWTLNSSLPYAAGRFSNVAVSSPASRTPRAMIHRAASWPGPGDCSPRYFGTDNAKYLGEQSPGPGQDAARWIIGRGVRLAGDDTATFEKRPASYGKELFSVHMMLLTDNGIYIVENMNLEPLSAAKAYTVALVITPLKIQGGTGSPLRALAVAP